MYAAGFSGGMPGKERGCINNMEERIPERYQGIKAEPPKYKEYRIVSPVEKHMVKYALDLGYKIKLNDFLGSVPCPFKWEFPGGISENADCFVILYFAWDTSEEDIQRVNKMVIEEICDLLDDQYAKDMEK